MKKDKKKFLRVSISYQGTMPVTDGHLGTCMDDGMRLTLSIDGCADILAYAVVNFPEIDGRKVLFIHRIFLARMRKQRRGHCWRRLWILQYREDIPASMRIRGRRRNGSLKGAGFRRRTETC